jgi:predicted acylesterase/phospholipase RssA
MTLRSILTFLLVCCCISCGTLVVRDPVPLNELGSAQILGRSDLRIVPMLTGAQSEEMVSERLASFDPARSSGGDQHILALSGGGANGAFGAGLLAGWTESGGRPDFDVVTGVSTGALSAPFAFLGSQYDKTLASVFTTTSTRDVLFVRRFLALFRADSATDAEGLRNLVARHIDRPLLGKIAQAHAAGRRLFVATTNLDSGEPTIWDMGRIASLNHPGALDLFRAVLTASASIPVAFSPVYIPVEADGRKYDEMHVDGGVSAQVFLMPVGPAAADSDVGSEVRKHVWVIRNARLSVEPEQVKPRISAIGVRSVGLLIRSQGISNLYRMYSQAQREGFDFSLAYIGPEFTEEPTEAFDPDYMRDLYDYGFAQAANGHPWVEIPPGYGASE